jgi:protein O-GlcNAc transferase
MSKDAIDGVQSRLAAGWGALGRDVRAAEEAARAVLSEGLQHNESLVNAHNLLAVALMLQSRNEEALGTLASALERDPRSAGTNLNLGNALNNLGRPGDALPYYKRAAELDPRMPQAHNNLARALQALGLLEEAARSYREVLRIAPDHVETHDDLGTVLAGMERYEEAAASYRAALARNPDYAPALNNLGVTLCELDRHGDALPQLQKATRLDPDNPQAHNNLGNVLLKLRQADAAVASYRRAVELAPGYAVALSNLAVGLIELERFDEALTWCNKSLAADPGHADAYAARGLAYLAQGRIDESMESLLKALSIRPDHVEALLHLGTACQERGLLEESAAHFRKALTLDPQSADAHHNLGIALRGLSRHDEAITSFREALRIEPEHKYTQGALLWSELLTSRWATLQRDIAELRAGVRGGRPVTEPLTMMAVSEDPGEQRQCAATFYEGRIKRGRARLWKGERYRHERIRVAYVSADFREHAVAHCIVELLELHDRSAFEVIGASLITGDASAVGARLRRSFDRLLDVSAAGDLDAARLLREAEADIAVDLMGYTMFSRPGIFVHRPSPIQVGYLGYPGTTGGDFLDYILADRFVLPEEHRGFYSENVAYLPDSYLASDSRREISARTPSRAEVGLPDSGFVFCCFNNTYKVGPRLFDVWMRLLVQVPGSALWLLGTEVAAEENLRREAQARGVDAGRLVFARRVKDVGDYRARCRLADLVLDTLPYNGHATTGDMLWSGVPVLTCAGTTFAGRVAGSLLHAAGLPELVTSSLEEYEAFALRLARERGLLAELRAKLERNRTSAALFDTDRFRRHLESAYRTMWETAQRGEEPRPFSVPPVQS